MKIYNEICVSLDIETTGLSKDKDKIIEIGAIKFQGKKIIDKFETLINPEVSVPYEILSITGIKEYELKKAPKFNVIKNKLKKFIGGCPVVGHNINFDLEFLEQNSLLINNIRYDTWHLALILLPNLPGYSLESLAQFLQIEPLETHRALADAQTTKNVFLYLINLIYQIKKSLRNEINFFIKKSNWDLGKLFKKIKIKDEISKVNKMKSGKIELKKKKLSIKYKDLKPILLSREKRLLLAKKLKLNQDEVTLMENCFNALINKNFSFFISTSKPIGFLIPTIYYASLNNKKIIVIYNHNKKESLFNDIYKLKNFIPFDFDYYDFKNSYLCLRKFNNFKQQKKLSVIELRFLIKILLWLESYSSDLSLISEEKYLWSRLIHNPDDCLSIDCPFYQDCLFYQAYECARKTQIILIEQKRFFHAVLAKPSERILPVFRDLIINDAQSIEDNLINVTTTNFSRQDQEILLANINDSLVNLEFLLKDKSIIIFINKIKEEILNLEKKFEIFWGIWGMFWHERKGLESNVYCNLNEDARFGPTWHKIKLGTSSLILRLSLLSGILENLIQKIKLLNFKNKKVVILEFNNYQKKINEKILWFQEFILKRYLDPKFIYWFSFKDEGEKINLLKTPLEIRDLFKKKILDFKDSIILISGAISSKQFNYLNSKIGISNFVIKDLIKKTKRHLPSIFIIESLGVPEKPGYKKKILNWFYNFIKTSRGNTFILFNSKESIKEVYKNLLPLFNELKINVFSQENMSIKKILENFKREKKISRYFILGRDNLLSNLTGLNLSLDNLIITKLPFESLKFPLRKAQTQKLSNGFNDYILPRCIINLRKILTDFLLISSKETQIYLLDSRLVDKEYGLDFLKSLSDFNLIYQK